MDEVKLIKKEMIEIGTEKFVTFLSEEEIQTRIAEIGKEISEDYAGKLPIFIGVLNGAFMFMADLMKNITVDCEMDFFKLSSYGDEKISSGRVKLLKDLNADIKGRHLVLVEDIIDSGLSMDYIGRILREHNPASVKIVSLLMKPESLKYEIKIDYIGFKIPNKFVIGYGLDYSQKYRNLRSIFVLSE